MAGGNKNKATQFGTKTKQASDVKANMPAGMSTLSTVISTSFGHLLYGNKKEIKLEELTGYNSEEAKKGLFGKLNNILSDIEAIIPEVSSSKKYGIKVSEVSETVTKAFTKEFVNNFKILKDNGGFGDSYIKFWEDGFEDLIKSLKEGQKNSKIETKDSKVKASGVIEINITGASDLNNLIETLKKNDFKIDKNAIQNIEFLADKLNDLGQYINELHLDADPFEDLAKIGKSLSDLNKGFDDISSTQKIVKKLIEFFGNEKKNKASEDSLVNLFKIIAELNDDVKGLEFTNIKAAMEVVTNSAKLFDQNLNVDNKIDRKVKKLAELFKEDGPIDELIGSLKNTSKLVESKDISESIDVLDDFFKMVSTLGDIKLRYLFRSKASIKFIKSFLVKDIKGLIEKVKDFESIDKDLSTSFKAINSFFESIKNLGEIGTIDKMRMRKNIRFISRYLTRDFKKIFVKINQLAEGNKENMETVAKIKDVIETIIKLGEIDKKKMKDIKKGTRQIKRYIESDLKSLFDAIRENIVTEAQDKGALLRRVEYSDEVLKAIVNMNESMPKLGGTLKSVMIAALLIGEAKEMGTLISVIREWPKLTKTNETLLNEKLKVYISSIIEVNNLLETLKIKESLQKLFGLEDELNELTIAINKMIEMNDIIKRSIKFTKIINTLNNLEEVFTSIKDDYSEEIEKAKSLSELILNIQGILGTISGEQEGEGINADEVIAVIENDIIPFIAKLGEKEEFHKKFESLFEVDKESINKIDSIVSLIGKLDKLSKVAISAKVSNVALEGVEIAADKIKVIIGKLSDIDEKEIEKAEKSLKTFSTIVMISAAILIIGGLAMAIIKPSNLILFTASLSLFLFALTGVFKLIGDSLKDSMQGAKDAIILVAGAAMIMILGGMAMELVDVSNLLMFSISLSLFLFGVGGVFRLFHKGFENAMEGAQDAVIIIGGAAAVMLFGSMVMQFVNFGNAILFTISLAVFLFAIGGVFMLVHEGFESAMEGAEDASILIAVSAGVLLIGSLAMNWIKVGNLLLFTATLSLFLLSIGFTFKLFSSLNQESLEAAREAAILISVSAGILILGSLVMKFINYGDLILFTITLAAFLLSVAGIFLLFKKAGQEAAEGARAAAILIVVAGGILLLGGLFMKFINFGDLILFTVTLAVFLLSVAGIFLIFKKVEKDAMQSAIAAAIFIAISAAVLLIGAAVLMTWPDLILYSLAFIVLMGIFTLGMIYIVKKLNKNQKDVWGSILVMIALGVITIMMSYALMETVKAANLVSDWKTFAITVGIMAAVVYGLYLMARSLGQAGPEALGYIAIGEAIMAGLVGIIWLIGKAVSSIAQGIDDLARVSHADIDLKNLVRLLLGFGMLVAPMMQLGGMLPIIGLGAASMVALKSFVYDAADIIEKFASLKIPILDEHGEVIGYNIMSQSDFEKSVENIKLVVSTLGQAIIDVYDENPELFEIGITDLFTGGSKFSKVVKSLKTMGPMLSSIAKAIKDWASLKIPVYEGTKVVGYETITGEMFPKAAENISQVVLTLGKAVIDTYDYAVENGYGDMFDTDLGDLFTGGSKFSKVAKSLKTMGPMLSSIAKAIKDWSKLKIPIYEGTKVVGYETITGEAFPAAAENIKQVVITLGQAVIDTYDLKPELFTIENLNDLLTGGSKFSKVSKSLKTMGPMLCSIAKAIKEWSDLKIPIYEGTKIVGYQTIKDSEFTKAAENIKTVITTLGSAIIETYDKVESDEKTKGMFDPQEYLGLPIGKSKFSLVVKAFKNMGPMLTSIAQAIKDWVDLKIPEKFDSKGNPISYMSLTEGDLTKAAENIKAVLKCIGEALVETVEQNPRIFNDVLGTDAPAIVAANAMKIMGETLNLTATAVGAYASGKFPVFDGEGKYVKDLEVNLSDPKVLTKAAENIKAVLSCIGQALLDVVNDPNNKELFNEGLLTDAPATIAAEAIKNMAESLNSTVDTISKLAQLNIKDLVDQLDREGPKDNIYHQLNNLLTFTADIFKLFTTENSDIAVQNATERHWYGDKVKNMSFAAFVNEYNEDVKDANTALGTFTNMLSSLISNFGTIGTTYKSNIAGINQLGNINRALAWMMQKVAGMIDILTNEDNSKLYKLINKNEKTINNGVNKSTGIIQNLLKQVDNIKKEYEKIVDFDLIAVKDIISKFNECVNSLKYIGTPMDVLGESMQPFNGSPMDARKVTNEISLYEAVLRQMISVAALAERTGEEGYNILRDGILKIYSTVSEIEYNLFFKQHTDELERYVKIINSLDMSRLEGLTNLVNSMNELSLRLGNLDNLTDAISNRLTAVLLELVNQLRKAEATIHNAHKLQEKRKQLINDSIVKVKEIMDKPMIIEITQPDPENPGETPPARDDEGNIIDKEVKNENGKVVSGGELNGGVDPEAADVDHREDRKGGHSHPETPLTEAAFIRLMNQNMQRHWRKC